jgi:hypothetical protein
MPNSEPSADYDAGLCREFIVTGRCGHSDAEHDAISDASIIPPEGSAR